MAPPHPRSQLRLVQREDRPKAPERSPVRFPGGVPNPGAHPTRAALDVQWPRE